MQSSKASFQRYESQKKGTHTRQEAHERGQGHHDIEQFTKLEARMIQRFLTGSVQKNESG